MLRTPNCEEFGCSLSRLSPPPIHCIALDRLHTALHQILTENDVQSTMHGSFGEKGCPVWFSVPSLLGSILGDVQYPLACLSNPNQMCIFLHFRLCFVMLQDAQQRECVFCLYYHVRLPVHKFCRNHWTSGFPRAIPMVFGQIGPGCYSHGIWPDQSEIYWSIISCTKIILCGKRC